MPESSTPMVRPCALVRLASLSTFLCVGTMAPAWADSTMIPPTDFGHLSQNATALAGVCAAGGMSYACGPVAAVNSLVFLQNMYPDVYDSSLIDTNLATTAKDLSGANFMNCAACMGGTVIGDFISGKMKWINMQVGAGKTVYADMQNPGFNFLFSQLDHKEDVELLVGFYSKATGARVGGHYVTLYQISGGATGNDLSFVDPNGGKGTSTAVNMPDLAYIIANGVIQIQNYGGPGVNTRIDWAVSESPVPEPGTIFLSLLLGPLLALLFVRRTRTNRFQ